MQLAEALGHAHDRGVLHRDLKTANVIATPAGRVKVLDFGLAKRLSVSELTTQFDATAIEHGTVAGTLAYMAPEQLRGQGAQASTDVWALGVVLYEMAHGVRPFQGKTGFELSAAILSEGPSPCASSIPAGLQSIIARCLEKEPGQRYRTGSEVCAALEMIQTRGDSLAEISATRPIGPAPPVRPASRGWLTRRRALWLGAAAIAVVAGVSAWKLWPTNVLVRSMAVLPFRNAQADEAVDHLCDGITEGLIRQIAEIPSLRVIALSRCRRHGYACRTCLHDRHELAVPASLIGPAGRTARDPANILRTYHLWTRPD
jgi:Protein kinase domain